SDANGDSMSHGWGANVLVAIEHAVLGVTPTAPGFATFSVSPPPATFTSVSGRVPTPRGAIAVAWKHSPDGRWRLDLTVPAGASAGVTMPGPVAHHPGARALGPATLSVGAGSYEFTA
ncbi:MAG TPA: alpha-L-rhamnosidase C-terminal domain-containing protein, partial [Acidimicrobiales bacterium]|nr:alpha-L-rhamnosidase C-terminal domain-containing protein [Acidimicrobiales bacterium]